MSTATPPNRQTRKRLATRQKISDIASRLFFERGFDQVTVDEIARAADVSRMTVFNHFARKEDLLFDLDQQGREDLVAAVEHRDPATSPVEALRHFVHHAVAHQFPYVEFFGPGTGHFIETVEASPALKSRAREIRDELTTLLATALAKSVHRDLPDPDAHFAATLLVATWTVAIIESRRAFDLHQHTGHAKSAFLNFIDRGSRGVQAALEGTPYA